MTNKKIIVNGVDVSECLFYNKNVCKLQEIKVFDKLNNRFFIPYFCDLYKDCYYKQLKIKEQECKTLKTINK